MRLLLAASVAFVVGACGSLEQPAADSPTTTRASTTTAATTTTLPGVSGTVRDGSFEFTVHRVGDPAIPPSGEPLGMWVEVELSVTNVKDDPKSFSAYNQHLVIGDAKYDGAYAADSYVDLNPGLGITTSIMFDVPPSILTARTVQVEVHDSMFSGGATVTVTPDWTPPQPPTTITQPSTTTMSEAEIDRVVFDAFLQSHSVLARYPLDMLYEVADAACSAWDDGASWEAIALETYRVSPADWDHDTVGYFLGGVVEAHCPEHKGLLLDAADTWG